MKYSRLSKIILSIMMIFGIGRTEDIPSGCNVNPTDAYLIVKKALMTSYNVFPIKIGGIPVMSWKELESVQTTSLFPGCVCMRGPVPLPGIKFSLHRAKGLVDVVKDPYCSPTLGMKIPLSIGSGKKSYGRGSSPDLSGGSLYSYEFHYFRFPLFALIDKLVDTGCVVVDPEIVLEYPSELNPLWHNDKYYALMHPFIFLTSHPVAQMSCIADCAKASINVGIRELFWCSGCWGTVYPATKNMVSSDAVSASGLTIHRMIANLHEPPTFTLKQEVGNLALCQPYPVAIPDKRQYSTYPVFPVVFPKRIPLGRSDLLWGEGLDLPFKNARNWTWILYSKRDCCAL